MLRFDSFFFKMLILTLSGILIASIALTVASTTISERLLLDQVVNNASTNLQFVQADLLDYNDQIVNAMLQVNSSAAFRNYITKETTTTNEHVNLVVALGNYIDLYKQYLSPDNSHIIVSGMPGTAGRHYSSNSLKWDKIPQNIVERYMTEEDGRIPNRIKYNSSRDLFEDTVPYDNYIFATKPLVDTSSNWMYGYVAVVLDEMNIYNKYSQYATEGTQISLISSEGVFLSSSIKQSVSKTNRDTLSLAKTTVNDHDGVWTDSQNKVTYISFYLPVYDAYLLEEIDQQVAFAPLYNIGQLILKVVIIVLLICMLFVYFISRKITRPLSMLVHTMQLSKGHDLKFHPMDTNGSYETKVLTEAYNDLIIEIDQHVDNLMHEQKLRRKADLSALQMQINPHFLYNTLSSIKYLAKMQKSDQVDQMINSLISILQNTIGSTEDKVTIDTEIETLTYYVAINQLRYGDQIKVDYHIHEDCHQLLIPKLIIQPFVENAFFHAFAGRVSGHINIFVITQGDKLMIEIMDDGIGMAVEHQLNASKKHHLSGIGIKNVDERIKLLYGQEYGVHIQSEINYGTSIRITLPIQS